ncbi:MAG: bifunctional methylenetetrahydrofolate dehydrogenase/methenyltetrahydrofolate cyclohydrolase FolD [Clostridia bacterium]|nr:bifunctional methylenetetrahydrofolate dehydrogenase/methenyltetrahydrofolate cyclohydrolase FolD [Clostridia bacterium]
MAQIIDGKNISSLVKEDVKKEIEALKQQNIKVCLAVIIVGDDPASKVYVGNKKKACEATGIESLEYALPADTTEEELLCLIEKLNNDPAVNGILCQLPLPKHINEKRVINTISAKKDVDAFHPENVGHIMIGDYTFLPCTPAGVMEMLERTGIEVQGKHCVIVGRSNIVGKPAAALMLNKSATVTVCHSKTVNLKEICLTADILIAAVGRANFITADMVRQDAIVIDVGINRNEQGKLCGDVDFEAVSQKASHITPVPGGVGPMTIAMLMKNTLTAAKQQNNLI